MGDDETLETGSVFAGSFRIVELLGQGEMGPAYVVDVVPSDTRCALKVLAASLVKQDAIRRAFVGSAKATSRVASAHLLQTLDAGIDPDSGKPWFTTDVLRGEDLAMRVGRWGPQSLGDVLALVAALGDALGKAHAQGLVHYDLTPENVHLGPGKRPAVTVRELTISRIVADACAAEGDVIGSAMWMAPEQFDLGPRLRPPANVWSLGLLAFYAATGRVYWLGASGDPTPTKALLREILHEPIAAPSARARALGCKAELPAWFDEWFARCVTRDPTKRFAEAHAAHLAFAKQFDDRPRGSSGDVADDQRTTTRLPPPAVRAKGSRSLPRAVIADAKLVSAGPGSLPPSGASGAALSTRQPGSPRRPTRVWGYLATLGAVALGAAWLRSDRLTRHRDASTVTTTTARVTASAPPSPSPVPPSPAHAPLDERETAAAASVTSSADAGSSRASDDTGAHGTGDVPSGAPDYDLAAALKAVNRVYYGSCAVPSAGKVAITFAPSGHVKKVTVLRGDYDEEVTACLGARFGTAKMSPFQGVPQTVTADLGATR